jgi:parallel beta-helix repeat protein
VTGTCTENIWIVSRQNLALAARSGQTATILAADPNQTVVSVFSSHNVYLYGLNIAGGWRGIEVGSASQVILEDCTIENNRDHGFGAAETSDISFRGGTIRNNGGDGINVGFHAHVNNWEWGDRQFAIANNLGAGVRVTRASFSSFGPTVIENNGGSGISLNSGATAEMLVWYPTGNVLRGNQFGITLGNQSTITLGGRNLIQDNQLMGLGIWTGSQTTAFTLWDENGSEGVLTIVGHPMYGVNVADRGEASFWGHHLIRNNGTGTSLRAGVGLSGGSHFLTDAAEIYQNGGPGVLVDTNSTVSLWAANVWGNANEGLLAIHQSVAEINSINNMQNNRAGSVACDTSSMILSTAFHAGARPGGVRCLNVEPPGMNPQNTIRPQPPKSKPRAHGMTYQQYRQIANRR